jgi:DNA repair protein RadC
MRNFATKRVLDMKLLAWPVADRPREKLFRHGPDALSDAELLALTLRSGDSRRDALEIGQALLSRFRSLSALFAAPAQEVCAESGLGPARYASLRAGFELAKRTLREEVEVRDVLRSPQAVRDYLRLTLQQRPVEVFMAVFLDSQHRVICAEELFKGTLTQTSVYPREVVKRALYFNCAAVILAHNHPSGLAEPSEADLVLTQSLRASLASVDIKVLDHFVVGQGESTSFAERGLL